VATLHSLSDGLRTDVREGETLLAALLRARVPIAHACGGLARCSTCRVRVVDGLARCTPRTDDEQGIAQRLGLEDAVRLACQTRATGDVEVRRLVLDPEDYELTRQFTARPVAEGSPRTSMGREAPVAVLFADVVGFTGLSERLPAYDVVHVLHRWFHLATGVVDGNAGRVDNYMGDGLLAVFAGDGPPPALAAVRAALGLLDAADRMATYLATAYGQPFAVRVGVHAGVVVVGSPTPWHRERDTVIGDVVNFASRIEAANKDLGSRLLVSDVVYADVAPFVRAGRRIEVEIRGKQGVHALVEVLGPVASVPG
jgi:class 3 adenylate cyclase